MYAVSVAYRRNFAERIRISLRVFVGNVPGKYQYSLSNDPWNVPLSFSKWADCQIPWGLQHNPTKSNEWLLTAFGVEPYTTKVPGHRMAVP